MATLIQRADFVGVYAIANDMKSNSILDTLMDEVELKTIYQLFGQTLGDLFLTDAAANSGVPTDPNYLKVYNALMLDDNSCYCKNGILDRYSFGIKKMLLAFVYVQFFNRAGNVSTQLGLRKVESSVSKNVRLDGKYLCTVQNKGVEAFRVIQRYIELNSGDYPDYNGQEKNYSHPF